MSNKNLYDKLGNRIAEEAQLLAEEKWLVESLAKIKKQRNSLQIERLHLENLKAKLMGKATVEVPETASNINEDIKASTSAVNMMQYVNAAKCGDETKEALTTDDALCNALDLNLIVNHLSIAQHQNDFDFDMEDEDGESDDDVAIDINMLMNGVAEKETKYESGKHN